MGTEPGLTDAELARLLNAHPDVPVVGCAADYTRLATMMRAPGEPGPPPAHPGAGGVFVAETKTDTDGNMWRRWHWNPDAEQWERDACAQGKLI